MFDRRFLICLLFAWAVVDGAQQPGTLATPKTDYSGRWRMVKDKSEFHGFQMPDTIIRNVEQHGPTMNVHTVQSAAQKTSTSDISYFTDGSITKNVVNGREAESKCYWDGNVLVVRTSMKTSKGDDELVSDRWELSSDGQTLTIASHVETERGGVDLKLVSEREKTGG